MKNVGSYFEYETERNMDLLNVYDSIRSADPNLPFPEVYKQAVNTPSKRFWVSEERASIVISNMLKGDKLESMLPTKREMYEELLRRFKVMRETDDEISNYDIIYKIVNSPAPRFFLTPGSAKIIIHKMHHKWYEERKRKYRFLFM